jgi:hypothetical protein
LKENFIGKGFARFYRVLILNIRSLFWGICGFVISPFFLFLGFLGILGGDRVWLSTEENFLTKNDLW